MSTERQKMIAGEMYDPFDAALVAARERARDLCQVVNVSRELEHDGSAPDLLAVVNHYDRLFGLNLTAAQKADLVEYLKSL